MRTQINPKVGHALNLSQRSTEGDSFSYSGVMASSMLDKLKNLKAKCQQGGNMRKPIILIRVQAYEEALTRFMQSMDESDLMSLRQGIYKESLGGRKDCDLIEIHGHFIDSWLFWNAYERRLV